MWFLEDSPTITDQIRKLISQRTVQVIIISISTLLLCQLLKFIFISIKEKKPVWYILASTGGFPSSHTAFVVSLDISLLILQLRIDGRLDWSFAVAVVFSIIVIHDAMGVRLEASKHARILNRFAEHLTEEEKTELGYGKKGRLKEMLGHRSWEVLGGLFVGIIGGTVGSLIYILIW